MTHETERTFHDRVVDELRERYGAGRVETNKHLQASGRYADIWVDLEPVALAIEVENDADSVRPGVAQALFYAHVTGADPVLVIPAGHVDPADRRFAEERLQLVELDA